MKKWLELSKSGIVTLVLISVLSGYLLGQSFQEPFSFLKLIETLISILVLGAGSSALNQVQEHLIDREMPRTKDRPIPSGRISYRAALLFSLLSIVFGLVFLYFIHPTLFWLGLVATVSYNGLYTLWWKKHWAYAAVPGAIPGALPVLMGHVSATNGKFTHEGFFLFFILFFWQMPHFWVLALRFNDDYASGGIPTLPVARGRPVTIFQITIWCLAYVALMCLAPLFLPVGIIYLISSLVISAFVLWGLKLFRKSPEKTNWLKFFLGVNLSLILYLACAAFDYWHPVLFQSMIVN